MDGWKKYEGKRVFIKLKNGREYSGIVLNIKEKDNLSLITIKDKYNRDVAFYDSEISVMEEENGKR